MKNRARNWWKPAVCGVSMLLILYGAALPTYAADTYVFRSSSGDYIRLLDEDCPVATGWLKMKRAEFQYQGKLYAACWGILRDVVLIFDESGDISPMPVYRFSKEQAT